MITEQEVFDALPPEGTFLNAYVNYAARMTDAHASFHVICGLMMLSQAVPSEYAIPFASKIYANMYGLCIADSSVGKKSTSVKIAKAVLEQAIPGAVLEKPGSEEGFQELLREKPKSIVIYEEFGEFLMKAGEGYFERLKAAYLSVYDGAPIGRALAKSRRGSIDNPRFSMLGAVATDILDHHTSDDDWTSGFMARFFCAFGVPERKYRKQPLEDTAAKNHCIALLRDRSVNLKILGKCLWLDEEASELWDEWYDYRNEWMQHVPRELRAGFQRAEGMLQKVAMLLAWDMGTARTGADWKVDRETLAYSIQILDIHLQSLAGVAERLANTRDMRLRRQVLDAIGVAPTSMGAITRTARVLKDRRLMDVLETLCEEGVISRVNNNGRVAYQRVQQLQVLENGATAGNRVPDQYAGGIAQHALDDDEDVVEADE